MNKTKSKHPLLTLDEKDKFYLALSQTNDAVEKFYERTK